MSIQDGGIAPGQHPRAGFRAPQGHERLRSPARRRQRRGRQHRRRIDLIEKLTGLPAVNVLDPNDYVRLGSLLEAELGRSGSDMMAGTGTLNTEVDR